MFSTPHNLAALILVIIKTRKLIAIINLVGLSHYVFTNYLDVYAAFSKANVDSLKE